ncbi:hypothetical protein OURE66S_01215 [Oligella ureolytica]
MQRLLICMLVAIVLSGCSTNRAYQPSSSISFGIPIFDDSRLYTTIYGRKDSAGAIQLRGNSSVNFGDYGRNVNARLSW